MLFKRTALIIALLFSQSLFADTDFDDSIKNHLAISILLVSGESALNNPNLLLESTKTSTEMSILEFNQNVEILSTEDVKNYLSIYQLAAFEYSEAKGIQEDKRILLEHDILQRATKGYTKTGSFIKSDTIDVKFGDTDWWIKKRKEWENVRSTMESVAHRIENDLGYNALETIQSEVAAALNDIPVSAQPYMKEVLAANTELTDDLFLALGMQKMTPLERSVFLGVSLGILTSN